MHKVVPERAAGNSLKLTLAKIFIVLIYGVGLIGLSMPSFKETFLLLTPAQLLVTLFLILSFHRGWNDAFPIFAALAFWIGFGSELVGIHSGYLFGDYVYGPTLGPKLWEVPIVIGVNWFILAYLTGTVFRNVPNDYYAAFLGGFAMTALDYIMEPVAVALDFWYWKFDIIPFGNYLSWFLVSFLIHMVYRKTNFDKENPLALFLLSTLIFFFTILNFTVEV